MTYNRTIAVTIVLFFLWTAVLAATGPSVGSSKFAPGVPELWSTGAGMPTPRYSFACEAVNGTIYAIGGHDYGSYLPTVERYDPEKDSWSTGANMSVGRYRLASAVVDGRIYAIGGYNDLGSYNYLAAVECYDPETDSWSRKEDMPTAREGPVCGVVKGKIYAIGGVYFGENVGVVECYDPGVDSWSRSKNITNVSKVLSCEVIGDEIYVITQSTLECFNPANDTWRTIESRPFTNLNLASCAIDDSIYLIGGGIYRNEQWSWYDTVDCYDTTRAKWSKKREMPTQRENLDAAVVGNRIFVIGGNNEQGALGSVEYYTGLMDYDGDGKPNDSDNLPFDPAASMDTDGDGAPDEWNQGMSGNDSTGGAYIDAFPVDTAASVDSDKDGCPDGWNANHSEWTSTTYLKLDDFPHDVSASMDTDGDGAPDWWNEGHGEDNSTTGLRLDAFPFDPQEWMDTDKDGIGDNEDRFPNDPAASVDTDGDGYPDRWNRGETGKNTTTGLHLDAFPDDPLEWEDLDWPFGDNVGDNGDWLPALNNYLFYSLCIIVTVIIFSLVLRFRDRRREAASKQKLRKAAYLEKKKRLEDAIEIFEELGITKEAKRLMVRRADELKEEGDFERAAEMYESADRYEMARSVRKEAQAKAAGKSDDGTETMEGEGDVTACEEGASRDIPRHVGGGCIPISTRYRTKLAGLTTKEVRSEIDTILPQYRFHGLIGSGGFASVYAVKDAEDRKFALKLPKFLDENVDYETLQKYKREGDILATLEHKNIVKFTPGETIEIPYLSGELLEGGSLGQLMKKHRLTVGEATEIMLQLLDGLSYAHRMGIIHLDLKPENILFTQEGILKITDWGIGKHMTAKVGGSHAGSKGTISYCAPEQFDKERYQKADWRTDIFQAGILFYRMLTGKNPFRSRDVKGVMNNILYNIPDPPSKLNPEVPEALDRIVMQALEKRKEYRWRSADIMYDRLRELAK